MLAQAPRFAGATLPLAAMLGFEQGPQGWLAVPWGGEVAANSKAQIKLPRSFPSSWQWSLPRPFQPYCLQGTAGLPLLTLLLCRKQGRFVSSSVPCRKEDRLFLPSKCFAETTAGLGRTLVSGVHRCTAAKDKEVPEICSRSSQACCRGQALPSSAPGIPHRPPGPRRAGRPWLLGRLRPREPATSPPLHGRAGPRLRLCSRRRCSLPAQPSPCVLP